MFCKNCGSEIPEGAKFCAKCGQETAYTADSFDYEHEEEYVYGNAGTKPAHRAVGNASIILGIIGIIFLVGVFVPGEVTTFCIWSIIFGVLALIFGCRFIVNNKRFPKRSKYVGLIFGIIDTVVPIIMLIIQGVAYHSLYR